MSGAAKSGSPTQAAEPTAAKSTCPASTAATYPTTTPMRIDSRPASPRATTATTTMVSSVSVATQGAAAKLDVATPPRLKPMRATIAPVTTGGISASIQPVPVAVTTRPTAASSRPVTMIPKRAAPIPWSPIEAWIGAMNANDEPR